jgi:hypothetical protein
MMPGSITELGIMNDTDLAVRAKALQELLATHQTLLLSTASITGIPDISYARVCGRHQYHRD